MSQNNLPQSMQHYPRPPIHFLIQDRQWQTAVERFRSPQAIWKAQVVGDWNELVRAITSSPKSFSIIEVAACDAATWIRRIGRLGRFGSNHRVAVVGSREIGPLFGPLCELGVIFCGFSISDCPRLAQFVERFATTYPEKPLPLRESIFNSLPWSTAADERSPDRATTPDHPCFNDKSKPKND